MASNDLEVYFSDGFSALSVLGFESRSGKIASAEF